MGGHLPKSIPCSRGSGSVPPLALIALGGDCMDDVMRFYDGGMEAPLSPPDWVSDDAMADYWAGLDEDARRDALADVVACADEVPAPPDVLCGDLSDDEATARGLAVADTMPKDNRLRWWEIVAWHDSIADDWAVRWDARPDVRGLAIWHDRDVKDADTGELKKKHLHAMAGDSHGRKWSRAQALRFARDVFGLRPGSDDRLVRPIKSPSGYALYLTHANAPQKVQYARDAVMSFGGVDLDSVVGVVDNERMVFADIRRWISDFYQSHGALPALALLTMFADARRPSWARFLATSHGAGQVKGYIRSVEYDLGLDGRGAGTILLVDELIEADEEKEKALKLKVDGVR